MIQVRQGAPVRPGGRCCMRANACASWGACKERRAFILAGCFPTRCPCPPPLCAGTIARQCTAAIFFLQVTVGVLLPLYILCCSMRELTLPPSLPVPTTSSWGQLQRGAAWAYAASNRAVWHAFCAARTSLLPPTLVLWLAVALSWTATLLLHGL